MNVCWKCGHKVCDDCDGCQNTECEDCSCPLVEKKERL
jgi:hypothetical protein